MHCASFYSKTDSIDVINNNQSFVTSNVILKKFLNAKKSRVKRQDEDDEDKEKEKENENKEDGDDLSRLKLESFGFWMLVGINAGFIGIIIIIIMIKFLCQMEHCRKGQTLKEKNLSSLRKKIYWKRCLSKFSCYSKEFVDLIKVKLMLNLKNHAKPRLSECN